MPQAETVWYFLEAIEKRYHTTKEAVDCFNAVTRVLVLIGSIPSRDRARNEVTLYVRDLDSTTTEQDLEEAFSDFGIIENIMITSKGNVTFGFVTFKSKRSTQKALQAKISVTGFPVRVELAYKKTQNTKKTGIVVNN